MDRKKILAFAVSVSLFLGGINIIFTSFSSGYDYTNDRGQDKTAYEAEEGLLNSSWPIHRNDRKRTGQSSFATNGTEDLVKWKFSTGDEISASPVVGNGTIYVGSLNGNLYAVDKKGHMKWKFKTGNIIISSLAIDDEGTIYFGSGDGKLYALHQNGSLEWSYDTEGHITSSPAVAENGTIYISSYSGLFAISENGSLRWNKDIGRISHSSPSLDENGNIYLIKKKPGKLYSFSPDGAIRWTYNLDEENVISTPVLDENGNIYANSKGEKLYSIDQNGTLRWSFKPKQKYHLMAATSGRSLALSKNGTIYFGSAFSTLYAVNQTGAEIWNLSFDGGIGYSSPSIGKNGILYVGSFDHDVYAVNPNGAVRWNYTTGDKIYSSPAIGKDGTVYIGSMDSRLYAFSGKAPRIYDKTANQTNTSDILKIKAGITDNRKVKNASLTYWFGKDDPTKKRKKMDDGPGDLFLKKIEIPSNSTADLYYKITAEDAFGNENETAVKKVAVKDDISPEAEAGKDRKIGINEETVFNGSKSADNIGIENYTWSIGSEEYYGETVRYTFGSQGEYEVTLRVKDEANNSDTDAVNVTVEDMTEPIADAGSDMTVEEDSVTDFNASGSYDNVGITNYTWSIQRSKYFGKTVQYKFQDPGDFVVKLNVTDSSGNHDTDLVNVTVEDVTPPKANAGENRTVDVGNVVEFNGSASTDNVGIENHTWNIRGNLFYGKVVKYEFTETGDFNVTLRVEDIAGNEDSDVVIISVRDGVPPKADAGEDKIVDEDVEVVLDGSNSSDNVDIEEFQWTINGAIYHGEKINYTFKDPGNYTVLLNVTDLSGNWDTDIVNITVRDTTPPNAEGGDDRLAKIGTNTTFDASNSTDNGRIVNYTWIIRRGEEGKKIATLYGEKVNFTFEKRGVVYVTLIVEDSGENTDEDTFRVGVNHRIPGPGILPFLFILIGLAGVWKAKKREK